MNSLRLWWNNNYGITPFLLESVFSDNYMCSTKTWTGQHIEECTGRMVNKYVIRETFKDRV